MFQYITNSYDLTAIVRETDREFENQKISFNIALYDQTGQQLELNGFDWSISLFFCFEYTVDHMIAKLVSEMLAAFKILNDSN